jgi:delta-aminolevulinic acid dehydratase/porphobilinogen synthase
MFAPGLMAMNASVPSHIQERAMKEVAMVDARSSHKQSVNTHKILSDNVLASSANYTTQTGPFTSQMKSNTSQQSKKAYRMENTSQGPTGKFKSSAKVTNLSA